MVAELCEHMTKHGTFHCKWLNCMYVNYISTKLFKILKGWEANELRSKGAVVGGNMISTIGKKERRPMWPVQGGTGMRSG